MLFGKKEKTDEPAKPAKPRVEPFEIHVMPPKFHKYLSVKKKGSGRLILIIVIIAVVLAGGALGAYYLMKSMSQVSPALPTNINQPSEVNTNRNLNQVRADVNENINADINENINAVFEEDMEPDIIEDININENSNVNTNLNVPLPAPALTYTSSTDSDRDGLTDVEEELYGTEKNRPDTDGDGFLDGEELIGGYNPKVGGGALLETSGLVNKYNNPVYNYEILYPAAWLARPLDQSLKEVIFQSNTNEYIQIFVEENPEELDLVDWYLTQSPLTSINLLTKEKTRKGYDALLSPDKLTYYIKDDLAPEKVFLITYNIGNLTRVNFLTTFKMMVNSFVLTRDLAPASEILEEETEEFFEAEL
ncbi:MAG TPA: hypothetical protein ENN28_03570 [Candidatus Uhrbacteria bacterium]|nr:hypothetical protein [Candidatus Uhrbacteria bacterium]